MSDAQIDVRIGKPLCPQCGLPMRLSHLEPATHAEDRFIWRCICGESLEKVSLRESPSVH